MKTIKQEDFTKLNKALRDLEEILACMGVKEFSLSRDRHNMQMDTNADNIETVLLYYFCSNIEQIHDAMFGSRYAA